MFSPQYSGDAAVLHADPWRVLTVVKVAVGLQHVWLPEHSGAVGCAGGGGLH